MRFVASLKYAAGGRDARTVQYSTAQRSTAQCSTAQHSTASVSTISREVLVAECALARAWCSKKSSKCAASVHVLQALAASRDEEAAEAEELTELVPGALPLSFFFGVCALNIV
jgi:hypothetical protein